MLTGLCPSQAGTTWSPCSAPCGGLLGFRARPVSCEALIASRSASQVATGTLPDLSLSASDNLNSTGSTGTAFIGRLLMPDPFCEPATRPAGVQSCTSDACPPLWWLPSTDWSACSAPCTAITGSATSESGADSPNKLGVSTASGPVCTAEDTTGTAVPVPESVCTSAGLVSHGAFTSRILAWGWSSASGCYGMAFLKVVYGRGFLMAT
jgi:hypothetical protein